MISGCEIKTNEFLRRRKLRLQQVREQSKDIAKKVRQRAKVEKLKHLVNVDASKEREYLQQQEKLIRQLEDLYVKGLDNVGVGHKKATQVIEKEVAENTDLSKLRGREAVAELRRRKQEQLDEQKKILDRKLQAREAANEISREKISKTVIEVLNKLDQPEVLHTDISVDNVNKISEDNEYNNKPVEALSKNDMATQWDYDGLPYEWVPAVPALVLPKDDCMKETNDNNESKTEKSKRTDLFALSDEMPSSLRGGLVNLPDRVAVKPSLSLVSEYIQNRCLRLRESETCTTNKKDTNDLQSLKHTIIRTRASRTEVSAKTGDRSKLNGQEKDLTKKNSVTMYDHSTRDSRDIPYAEESKVVRDLQIDDDAYSQAAKQSNLDESKRSEHDNVMKSMRNKIAMTKQNVEKEYKDTMEFLNSLPKEKCSRANKTAYMSEERQQARRVNQQNKMEQEFRKINKECKKHNEQRSRPVTPSEFRSKSKSPSNKTEHNLKDIQYSWMPVPESDGNLAIHTIPTSVKNDRSGNTVTFSKVDSYHEYRSRHKHTPPTKDTATRPDRKVVETVIIKDASDDSTNTSLHASDASSIENLETKTANKTEEKASDTERIIIYKILESKRDKKKAKAIGESKSLTLTTKHDCLPTDKPHKKNQNKHKKHCNKSGKDQVSFEHLSEGIYKSVNEKGDNITSMYYDSPEGDRISLTAEELRAGKPCCCSKKLTSDQKCDKGTDISWDSGDRRIRLSNCNGCKRTSSSDGHITKNIPASQTSPVASTASFKTATNNKTNNALPVEDFVKLIGDDGQESGKFYIGASGFLKDEDYEVVIQLKKKETVKNNKNHETDGDKFKYTQESSELAYRNIAPNEKSSQDSLRNSQGNDSKSQKTEKSKERQIQTSTDSNVSKELLSNKSLQESKIINSQEMHKNGADSKQSIKSPKSLQASSLKDSQVTKKSETESEQSSSESESKVLPPVDDKLHEYLSSRNQLFPGSARISPRRSPTTKSTSRKSTRDSKVEESKRSLHISYAVPDKTRPQASEKRTTSAFTQTTLSSPVQKSTHVHMSSSTSTAYMSPPEMILPKFLKQDYPITYDEVYTPMKNMNFDDTSLDVTEQEYCECYSGCSCKRCAHTKNNVRKINDGNNFTPPNTARSYNCKRKSNQSSDHSELNLKKLKCKSYKCGSHAGVKICTKSSRIHRKKTNNTSANKSPLLLKPKGSNKTSWSKIDKKDNNLNPVIKNYVNKLLALNKEGLKAMEVINQDCSYVTTPGSSIINLPSNTNKQEPNIEKKISLEQIKDILTKQILKECESNQSSVHCGATQNNKYHKGTRNLRKKSLHKVKSLNITKQLLKTNKIRNAQINRNINYSSSSSPKDVDTNIFYPSHVPCKMRNKYPSPRHINKHRSTSTENEINANLITDRLNHKQQSKMSQEMTNKEDTMQRQRLQIHSTDSECNKRLKKHLIPDPITISTQTSINESETNLIKSAEEKLQNMEKIAELTEKCTKRLSNLAKVLEEVRKNKSLAYSQISTSDSTSDSDQRIERNLGFANTKLQTFETRSTTMSANSDSQEKLKTKSPLLTTSENDNNSIKSTTSKYVSFLVDIPKPSSSKSPAVSENISTSEESPPINISVESIRTRNKGKPPPAMPRLLLKHTQDLVMPHELSTVIEVDSPMSMRLRNQSVLDDKNEIPIQSDHIIANISKNVKTSDDDPRQFAKDTSRHINPDLLQSNFNLSQLQNNTNSPDPIAANRPQVPMMDLEQFNEIMLEPFISIHEYAKQCNTSPLDAGSNFESKCKNEVVNEDLSSLHSDGSLPDVISELLKRNIISEPFKFDSPSIVNSTTVSSESTLSVLALSKMKKDKKSNVSFKKKETMAETSDTLSLSSNPDLENAFKKLGMGWASSTLKKTKERLALSSSSNTSSSSMSQFKIKSFNGGNMPPSDSVSSVTNDSKNHSHARKVGDIPRNAQQQTSITNSMTVKEFLTQELANKITFTTNKSRNNTEEEFISLYETKMPEEMKHLSRYVGEERSNDSTSNNRARTSTPVQLFKSMTYHSSSSSNMSNGLFSNVDELSSVKMTSNSLRNHSTSEKDDLTIPNYSLRLKKCLSDHSKSD